MHMSSEVDAVLAATGSKATYGGSATIIGGWWLSSEFAVLVGMIVGVVGLIVQFHYKRKLTNAEIKMLHEKNERDREAHALRMADLRAGFHVRGEQ
jgi:O-antigen ligase